LIKVEVDFGAGKALATVKVVVAGKDGVPGANTSNLLVQEMGRTDVSSEAYEIGSGEAVTPPERY
jgi:hypothetical protein